MQIEKWDILKKSIKHFLFRYPYSLPPPYPVSTPGLSNMRSDYWSSEDKVSFQLSLCKISNFPLTKPLLLFIQHFSDSDGGSWTWHTWWMKYISIYWKSATNLIEYKFAVQLKVFLIQNTLFLKSQVSFEALSMFDGV